MFLKVFYFCLADNSCMHFVARVGLMWSDANMSICLWLVCVRVFVKFCLCLVYDSCRDGLGLQLCFTYRSGH